MNYYLQFGKGPIFKEQIFLISYGRENKIPFTTFFNKLITPNISNKSSISFLCTKGY